MADEISVRRFALHQMILSRHNHPSLINSGLSDVLAVLDRVLADLYGQIETLERESVRLRRELDTCKLGLHARESGASQKPYTRSARDERITGSCEE
jgi:hypothetical protein